ncbi:MAG: preprotein translocase subunit YajC [Actinomycetota bacterium]
MVGLLAQNSQQGGSALALFLPLLLMGGVFYFLLIRPQQKRVRAQQALLSAVEPGDEVITTAGIYGTVVEMDETEGTVEIEIAPGTRVRMLKSGIARRVVDEDEGAFEDDVDEEPGLEEEEEDSTSS